MAWEGMAGDGVADTRPSRALGERCETDSEPRASARGTLSTLQRVSGTGPLLARGISDRGAGEQAVARGSPVMLAWIRNGGCALL